jgi:drug/metabolite transporter (DMT)-like permease
MKRFAGAAYLAGAFMLAGTSVVAARFVSGKLGPFTIAAMSLLFALPALLAACRGKLAVHVRKMGRREWLLALLQAVFGIFLFRMFLLKGLLLTSSAEAGILTGATPAATALLAGLVLREPVGAARAAGIACTVAGVMLLQGLLLPGSGFTAAHIAGNMLVLCAALSESAFNILSRVSVLRAEKKGVQAQDPIVQTALVAAAAFVLCLIPAALERPVPSLLALDAPSWLALLWYGLFITALAFIFWYSGIRRSEASVAAAFSGMMPLTAMALSVLLLGERPGWRQWAGGLLVVVGMLLSGLKTQILRKRVQVQMDNKESS